MTETYDTFDARLRKIDRSRARLAHGYAAKVTDDGLIVFRPRRHRSRVSLRGLVLLAFGFVLFKAMILTHLGTGTYEQRLEALGNGSIIEKGGAFVMQIDPATQVVAQTLRPILR
ncbi:MAG: hypothetical protein NXH74_09775 [Rhodobacteraceae bacterium]|nr:hypothetical protein [Paracoccaceae bacterium]